MDSDTFLNEFLAFLFLGIPGAALTIRFVLRSMLKEVVEGGASHERGDEPGAREALADIEESQQIVGHKLDRLLEAERFRQQSFVVRRERETPTPRAPAQVATASAGRRQGSKGKR